MSIRVQLNDQEQTSGDREPLPVGKYHMAITDVQMTSPKDGDNVGKPMLLFEFTVQDSDDTVVGGKPTKQFTNRKNYVNACLWEGAMFAIVGILKAIGEYENFVDGNGNLEVPDAPEFYLTRQLFVRMAVNNKQKKRFPENPDYWIQASGYSPYKAGGAAVPVGASASSGSDSLLP